MTKCDYCGKYTRFSVVNQEGFAFCNGTEAESYKKRSENIVAILQELYENEVNFEISCFWDNGFTVRLGDFQNGFNWVGSGFNTLLKALHMLVMEGEKK